MLLSSLLASLDSSLAPMSVSATSSSTSSMGNNKWPHSGHGDLQSYLLHLHQQRLDCARKTKNMNICASIRSHRPVIRKRHLSRRVFQLTGEESARVVLDDLISDLMLTKFGKNLYIGCFLPNHELYTRVIAHSTLLQTFTKVVKWTTYDHLCYFSTPFLGAQQMGCEKM